GEVERTEPERAALDDRAVETRDRLPAPLRRLQLEPEPPRLPRLLDPLEPLELLLERLADVFRLLLAPALAVAALLPLLHPPALLDDSPALRLVVLVVAVVPL